MNNLDNQVVFAAAGNGKTYSLCSKARSALNSTNKYVLLVSYTNEGIRSLEREYRKQNYGVLDDRVIFKTWYSFLLSDFIKPYQCELRLKEKIYKQEHMVTLPENYISSIAFYSEETPPKWFNKSHFRYFINQNGDVVPDRASHLALLCNEHSAGKAIARIEEIYSYIFIDELQDYAGWDLEIFSLLFRSTIPITCVGDYKQATYRPNNSPKNKQYRDEKVRDYFLMLKSSGLCDVEYDNTTRRFNQEICDFINTIHMDPVAEVIVSPEIQQDVTDNCGVYILSEDDLEAYCEKYHPVVLRYDKRAKIPFNHTCDVFNYGASKGATYDRVVIVPVSTALPFLQEQKIITSDKTRAKFYVACTRAKYSIVFAMKNPTANTAFQKAKILCEGKMLSAYKFKK